MHEHTLSELSGLLAGGDVSSVELTRHFLDRIASLDPRLNAFITVTPEAALASAEEADQRRAAGESRAPDRRSDRPQGYFLHRRGQNVLRVTDARQFRFSL